MKTHYAILKHHFDKLLFGGYPNNTGLEPIRDVYSKAYNSPINMHDIYSSKLNLSSNPISEIITLVGPDDYDDEESLGIPVGVMPSNNSIAYVNIFEDDILKGLSGGAAKQYAEKVHDAMFDIVMLDRFYGNKRYRIRHPYMEFIKAVPLYFSFHHIKECVPCVLEDDKTFTYILEKYYICDEEKTKKVYDSLMESKYSENIEDIISTVFCKNTVEFF